MVAYVDGGWNPGRVLRGVSFVVKPGERGFVGATGAARASIVNLISRFYEFQKGRITIDGVDIRDILVDVRSRLVWCCKTCFCSAAVA